RPGPSRNRPPVHSIRTARRGDRAMADGPKIRTVSDIMSTPAVTAEPSETVAAAAGRMDDRKVGSVVVVDGTRPVGILTERDLVRVGAAGVDTAIAKVSEWMTE